MFVLFNFSLATVKKYKSTTSTSSLLAHLSFVHKIEEKEADQNKLTNYFGTSNEGKNVSVADKHTILARRLVLLCARSLISYNSVTSEAFTDFFKSYGITAQFETPHRTTLTRTALGDVYRDSLPIIKDVIKASEFCAVTFDIWTDNYRRKSYVTFNYCCVTNEFKLQNLNLNTLLMPYRHKAADVLMEFKKVIRSFNIDTGGMYTVTDKGSNLVKLITDENLDHEYCLGHGFHNLINDDGFARIPEIDNLLTKIKKIVRALRFRSSEVEEEVNQFLFFVLKYRSSYKSLKKFMI